MEASSVSGFDQTEHGRTAQMAALGTKASFAATDEVHPHGLARFWKGSFQRVQFKVP